MHDIDLIPRARLSEAIKRLDRSQARAYGDRDPLGMVVIALRTARLRKRLAELDLREAIVCGVSWEGVQSFLESWASARDDLAYWRGPVRAEWDRAIGVIQP